MTSFILWNMIQKLEFNFRFKIHFLLCVFDVIVIFVNWEGCKWNASLTRCTMQNLSEIWPRRCGGDRELEPTCCWSPAPVSLGLERSQRGLRSVHQLVQTLRHRRRTKIGIQSLNWHFEGGNVNFKKSEGFLCLNCALFHLQNDFRIVFNESKNI